MPLRVHRLAALLLAAGAIVLSGQAPASEGGSQAASLKSGPSPASLPAAPRKRVVYIDGRPDTSSYFLHDTTVLARVDERTMRAREYVETYYASYAEDRPSSDSLGRVEWLNSMIDKEVMARVAREVNPPLDFEGRVVMREHTERVLSNVLFQRMVIDSISVDEAKARVLHGQLNEEVHLREILCGDRPTADRVRAGLANGQLSWSQAYAQYSIARGDRTKEGDLGWLGRLTIPIELDEAAWGLRAGAAPIVVKAKNGFHVVQCLERRPSQGPEADAAREVVKVYLRNQDLMRRMDRLQSQLRAEVGLTYDSANIAWAASHFRPTRSTTQTSTGTSLRFNTIVPVFKPADTSRVLARYPGGQLTLRRFIDAYKQIPALKRPSVDTPETFQDQIDSIVLEPYRARLAIARGLERDSLAVALIEKKREQLMVERIYRDSIEAQVRVNPEERRRYYDTHKAGFITYPAARYAVIIRPSRAAADSLAERLRKGERAEAVIRADSIRLGRGWGAIKEEREGEHSIYHKLVFEELKPGQVEILSPDEAGRHQVVQLLSFDPGHQLSYEESKGIAQDALQALATEQLLKDFLARHSRRFRITSHPELVMRIKLVDPMALTP